MVTDTPISHNIETLETSDKVGNTEYQRWEKKGAQKDILTDDGVIGAKGSVKHIASKGWLLNPREWS